VLDGDDDSAQAPVASRDVTAEVRDVLNRHARALRRGEMTAFLDDVDEARKPFAARQKRYFLNLRQLPLAKFGWRVPDNSVTETDDGLRAVVELRMQLQGYDAAPVLTPQALTFTRSDDDSLKLAGDRDREFEDRYGVERAPWDLMRIDVEVGDGVLGVFDAKSVDAAYQIIGSVERGIDAIDAEVPLTWSNRVVVYALSDIRPLAELDNLPGGDPDRLDGVAFPVRAGPRTRQLASTRFMLHPRMIYRNDQTRDRLIRHELTHVALGLRDDKVPTWLSEGIAEYVSVQPIATYRRMIARDALTDAQAGVDGLPRDKTFNGSRSGANYGIAWFACEYISATYGEDALWRLFDMMRAEGGTGEKGQDKVIRDVLGIRGDELADSAAQKIVNTFG
ncbi:MAG: hypothetical protein ACXWXO_17590, partial [Nocardioides sp.]